MVPFQQSRPNKSIQRAPIRIRAADAPRYAQDYRVRTRPPQGVLLNKEIYSVQQWFDRFEITLGHEAEQAGLLEHSSLVGSAREFIVKRVLRAILPPIVHIGSGKVVDSHRKKSRQIDIVIYDSRFPVFEIQSGIEIYLLEGVIATIEVKSILTKKSLFEALENTLSLIQVTPGLVSASASRWMSRAKALQSDGYSPRDAMRKVGFEFIPATYIYAFNSKFRAKGLSTAVNNWCNSKEHPIVCDDHCAVLPRAVVGGNSLGLLHDGLIQIDPGADVIAEWKKDNDSGPNHVMSFWDTKRRFGWLMIHLLHTVCSRVGLSNAISGAEYGIDQYLSIEDYFKKDLEGKPGWHDLW